MKASETVNDTIKHALLKERVKFIELMVMNGYVMRNFLTVQNLAFLYNEAVRQAKRSFFSLLAVLPDDSRKKELFSRLFRPENNIPVLISLVQCGAL